MIILVWAIVGLIAGWLASIIMRTDNQQGPMMDIILGVLGGLAGGFIMNLIGAAGVTGFNLYSILVATIGAVALIWLRRAVA